MRGGDRFAFEAGDEIREILDVGVEHLHGDPLAHPDVLASVDGAHPAHRDELDDPVAVAADDAPDERRGPRLRGFVGGA